MMKQMIEIEVPEGCKAVWNQDTHNVDIVPDRKRLPTTWEEFCDTHPIEKVEYRPGFYGHITRIKAGQVREPIDKALLPTKELARAMIALCQLIQLRDCYNDGWQPDWSQLGTKYVIAASGDTVFCDTPLSCRNRILVFKNATILHEFYRNFEDLLEIAKPLL